MRWWMAAILAVLCLAVALLIPIPQVSYDRTLLAAEHTAQPMANIGPADRTPHPLSTPSPEDTRLPLMQEAALTTGILDRLEADAPGLLLAQPAFFVRTLDLEGALWSEASAAQAPGGLTLAYDAQVFTLTDPLTGQVIHEQDTADMAASPATIDWSFSPRGRYAAVCIANAQGREGSVLLYGLDTGDALIFPESRMARFSPDEESLYLIFENEGDALYRIDLPYGDPVRVTPKGIRVHSYASLIQGPLVRGEQIPQEPEEKASSSKRKKEAEATAKPEQALEPTALLSLFSPEGEVLHDFAWSQAVPAQGDDLFTIAAGEAAYMRTQLSGQDTIMLVDVPEETLTFTQDGEIPVSREKDGWLLRDAQGYVLRDAQGNVIAKYALLTP